MASCPSASPHCHSYNTMLLRQPTPKLTEDTSSQVRQPKQLLFFPFFVAQSEVLGGDAVLDIWSSHSRAWNLCGMVRTQPRNIKSWSQVPVSRSEQGSVGKSLEANTGQKGGLQVQPGREGQGAMLQLPEGGCGGHQPRRGVGSSCLALEMLLCR